MRNFRSFKVNGEDHQFMYLFGAPTRQEVEDFLKEFSQKHNEDDLYKITHNRENTHFVLWDARS